MVTPTGSGRTDRTRQPVAMGIVFELEKLAFQGRRLMYDIFSRVVKEKEITLTPVLFSRYGLLPSVAQGLEKLIQASGIKKKISVEKMAAEIRDQFDEALTKPAVRLDPLMHSLLVEAGKAKVAAGALSFLPTEIARELVSRFGLKDEITLQIMANNPEGLPGPDGWLKLAKSMALLPSRCLALTTCAVSCKSALAAGMRCVVIPDEFSVHQDFGGVDLVVEDLKELRCKDLLTLMHPCSFR